MRLSEFRQPAPGQRSTWGPGQWGAGREPSTPDYVPGRNGRMHEGQDTTDPCGSVLVAVADGEGIWGGHNTSGSGHTAELLHRDVVVDIPGVRRKSGGFLPLNSRFDVVSRAFHCQANSVTVTQGGQYQAGQVIGRTGNTYGYACHLHFELRLGSRFGESIDPSFLWRPRMRHSPAVEQHRDAWERWWWHEALQLPDEWREYVGSVIAFESAGRADAVQPRTYASGLFQHLRGYEVGGMWRPDDWRRWEARSALAKAWWGAQGVTVPWTEDRPDIFDPDVNSAVAAWLCQKDRTNYLWGNWDAWSSTFRHPWWSWQNTATWNGTGYDGLLTEDSMSLTCRYGQHSSENVKDWQRALNTTGAGLTVDGHYGPATRTATGTFQAGKDVGDDTTERVTFNTWRHVLGRSAPHRHMFTGQTEEA